MPCPRCLTLKEEAALGRALIAARRDGAPWKVLMARFDLGRTKLWQLWRAARDKDVREHLSAGRARAAEPNVVPLRRQAG